MRMSLSTSSEEVRKSRPPMPPLQPRTLTFTGASSFGVELPRTVPIGPGRVLAVMRDALLVDLVELVRIQARQVEQREFGLLPVLRPVGLQRLLPELVLLQLLLGDLALRAQRLVDTDR